QWERRLRRGRRGQAARWHVHGNGYEGRHQEEEQDDWQGDEEDLCCGNLAWSSGLLRRNLEHAASAAVEIPQPPHRQRWGGCFFPATSIPGPPQSRRKALMSKTVILSTARTPFGKMGGGLSSLDATDLGGTVISEALDRAEVKADEVQGVVYGQVLQAGQGQIPSRQAQIKPGIPREVPSETINKLCASGM